MILDNPHEAESPCTCAWPGDDPLCPVDNSRNWAAYRVLAEWMGQDSYDARVITLAVVAAMDADDEAHEIRRVEFLKNPSGCLEDDFNGGEQA